MSSCELYNADCTAIIGDIVKDTRNPVIVTDPPFNIKYHYNRYADNMPHREYLNMLGYIASLCPSVFTLYPETMHALSIEIGSAPDRVMSWCYPSNTARQHRDIAFYGVMPDFNKVRQPYKNRKDKRIIELEKRTGGARLYDWLEINQVKNVSKEKTQHPCQMPLELMDKIIGLLPDDATIIDPFMGSGTTIVAAIRRGHDAIGIEIDPEYSELAYLRIEELTGIGAYINERWHL